MATETSVTKENLQGFEARLARLAARRKKVLRSAVIGNIVGTLVFVFCLLTVACAAMSIIMDEKEIRVLSELPVLIPQWKQFVLLLPADLPFGIKLLIGCGVAVVAPFVVNLVLHIIMLLIPVKVEEITADSEIEKAKKLHEAASDANSYIFEDGVAAKIVGAVLYGIGVIFVPCYVTYVVAGNEISSLLTFEVIFASLLLVVLMLIPFGLLGWLATALCNVLYNHKKDRALTTAFSDYVKSCEKQVKEEKARKKEEERKREEEARKAKEKEDREKGAALYAQATATEQIDEDLLQEAADLGDPQAAMIIGKRLMLDGISDLYTGDEKERLMERAAGYFEYAKDVDTQGMLYWLCCRVRYESNTKVMWQSILKSLRNLKNKEELSEEDLELCETTMRKLVETIDNMVEYQPEPPREPRVKRKYCRFCGNGSVCTFYSTGSYLSVCNYPNNPGDCAAALMEKGIVYEFE